MRWHVMHPGKIHNPLEDISIERYGERALIVTASKCFIQGRYEGGITSIYTRALRVEKLSALTLGKSRSLEPTGSSSF